MASVVADGAASAGLRSVTSQLLSDIARVLDDAVYITSAFTDGVSIKDLVRCSLVGASGKRRRLDPRITGLASAPHHRPRARQAQGHPGIWTVCVVHKPVRIHVYEKIIAHTQVLGYMDRLRGP